MRAARSDFSSQMSEGEGAAAAAVDAVEARAAPTCCCCCCGDGGGGGDDRSEDSLERLCAKCRQRLLDEAKLAHPRPLTAADISKRAHVPLHKLQLLLNEEEQQHTPPALYVREKTPSMNADSVGTRAGSRRGRRSMAANGTRS